MLVPVHQTDLTPEDITVSGGVTFSGEQAAVLAALTHNLAIAVPVYTLAITLTGAQSLTGLLPGYTFVAGVSYAVENRDAVDTLTLVHGSGSSTYPFTCPGLVDLAVLPGQSAVVKFDGTTFRVLS